MAGIWEPVRSKTKRGTVPKRTARTKLLPFPVIKLEPTEERMKWCGLYRSYILLTIGKLRDFHEVYKFWKRTRAFKLGSEVLSVQNWGGEQLSTRSTTVKLRLRTFFRKCLDGYQSL